MKSVIATLALTLLAALPAQATAPASDAERATVLVFWASWCGACKPLLQDMAAARGDLVALGARIQTVAIDGAAPLNGLPGLDPASVESLKQAHGVRAVPWVVVVDDAGQVLSTPSQHHRPEALTDWLKTDLALNL